MDQPIELDIQFFHKREWRYAKKVNKKGRNVQVLYRNHLVTINYKHVRMSPPECESCKIDLHKESFQAPDLKSYCHNCLKGMTKNERDLLFGGPQWFSSEGQISIASMTDDHIVNVLSIFKKKADAFYKRMEDYDNGMTPNKYLDYRFKDFIEELRKRYPENISELEEENLSKKTGLIAAFISLLPFFRLNS